MAYRDPENINQPKRIEPSLMLHEIMDTSSMTLGNCMFLPLGGRSPLIRRGLNYQPDMMGSWPIRILRMFIYHEMCIYQ
jgi:hypothetical protein